MLIAYIYLVFNTIHVRISTKKPNIHGNVYIIITYIIYQVSMIPSSQQYYEEIYFSMQACKHENLLK